MPGWMKAALLAFTLVAHAQAAPQTTDHAAPAAPAAVAPAEAHAAGAHASPLLWRALALAVGAGVAWGLYRLGRGASGTDPRRHDPSR